jgi:hypothetical protein
LYYLREARQYARFAIWRYVLVRSAWWPLVADRYCTQAARGVMGGEPVTGPGREVRERVKTALRQEVGFCCPVQGCGSPYLTWHHFDPPWRVEHHHRPEGMIALCRPHADKADHGSFTDDQLRELKQLGRARAAMARGQFDWMRRDLLAVVGGNFYYETPVIFQVGNTPCIWFERDEDGYLLLNFKMPTIGGRPRAQIERNFWNVSPAVEEVICPPSGRLIEVAYPNGDKFRAEFFDADSPSALDKRYTRRGRRDWYTSVRFPLTVVELWETAAGTNIEFGPKSSLIGNNRMIDCFAGHCAVAIQLEVNPSQLSKLFPN